MSSYRESSLKPKEVGTIHTAIGYSTVIQLPQRPLNVVLGDQSAFRVEFINDSITIKPSKSGAKTNLFIFTENDRFNLTLKVGPSSEVDYVVRLRRIFSDPKKTVLLNRFQTQKGLRLSLTKATYNDRETFLDFTLQNVGKRNINVSPDLFRIAIDDSVRPIRSLYLDSTVLKPGVTVSGSLFFPSSNLGKKLTIWPGMRDEQPTPMSFLTQRRGLHAF